MRQLKTATPTLALDQMTTPNRESRAQRSATRAPVGKPINLQFDDSMDVVEGLCENISIGGMFIQVANTRPKGSLVRFELQIDGSVAIRGLGEVVWNRAENAAAGNEPGMGIKFRFLEQRDRQMIFKLVSQHIKERLAKQQGPALPTPVLPPRPPEPASDGTVSSTMPVIMTDDGPRVVDVEVADPQLLSPSASDPDFEDDDEPTMIGTRRAKPETAEPSFSAPLDAPTTPALETPTIPASLTPSPASEPSVPASEPPISAFEPAISASEPAPTFGFDPAASAEPLIPASEPPISASEPPISASEPPIPASEPPPQPAPSSSGERSGLFQPPSPAESFDAELTALQGTPPYGTAAASSDPELYRGGESESGPTQLGESPFDDMLDRGGSEPGVREDSVVARYDLSPPSRKRRPPWVAIALLLLVAAAGAGYWFRDAILGSDLLAPILGSSTAPSAPAPDGPVAEAPPQDPSPDLGTPEPQGATPTTAQTSPPPPAQPPPPPPRRTTASSTSPSTAGGFTRVVDIRWGPQSGGFRVVIEADGPIPSGSYRHFRLDGDSPREVIRLLGVSRQFDRSKLEVGSPTVRQIRTGFHKKSAGNELHVVLDLAARGARVSDIRTVDSGLEILITGP